MDSTARFSKTVDNYILYRPGYPTELLTFMKKEFGMDANTVIADIGSGTGKLTELLLQNESPVWAVEPNEEMRLAAENHLQSHSNFQSIAGTAEATNIPTESVDIITAAQAFHWFQPEASRKEFNRISRPNAIVGLIWNKRRDAHSDFMKSYNDFLLRYSTDYEKINLRRIDAIILQSFFGSAEYQLATFDYRQYFDFEGLKGRYLSCSYAYDTAHAQYDLARNDLEKLWKKHQKNGQVEMIYQTELYYGKLRKV